MVGSYPSTEEQSVYSKAPADREEGRKDITTQNYYVMIDGTSPIKESCYIWIDVLWWSYRGEVEIY